MASERRFEDREAAGSALAVAVARELAARPGPCRPLVLALPRGGVPVGAAIATRLGCDLDIVMVRKLGVPGHEELAAGALVDGDAPAVFLNDAVLRASGLVEADLEPVKRRELAEIERRRARYLGGRAQVSPAGRDVIVADDGIATGSTMQAALMAVRAQGPATVTLAVPVAPPDTIRALAPKVDHVVCLRMPEPFFAVGAHYLKFAQVGDDEVTTLLDKASAAAVRPATRDAPE